MKRLTSIVAVNSQGAIGCNNELPWRLKTDLRFFREQTLNQVVIMGRKTLDSMGRPLPKRHNIVLSHNSVLFQKTENSEVATSVAEALVDADKRKGREVFVVGGAATYKLFSPFVDRYLITMVDKDVPNADAHFDQAVFNNEDDWDLHCRDDIKFIPEDDEVPFQVFEMRHKRPLEIEALRDALVLQYKSKFLNRGKGSVNHFSDLMMSQNLRVQYQ
ncbi:dihydrofolate reductase [Sphingobium sp. WCS2017Hpa-17]|uniref:dihydrofolate reductase n=1 Tax=Sphingobium sp. WCS2017Hpa-17 TaxID=3073638 RepID=UPI002889758C|nr:dihydrofolate reductase [Sphingobium sp. WCS2017Hpa-17]